MIEFGNYLKKILPIIENFKDMTAGFIEAKNTSFEQFGVLVNYIMPEYEKSCLAVYCSQVTEGKLIFN